MKTLFLIILLVVLIAVGPLLTIWAINTLFPILAIEYSISTWAAVVILGSLVQVRPR